MNNKKLISLSVFFCFSLAFSLFLSSLHGAPGEKTDRFFTLRFAEEELFSTARENEGFLFKAIRGLAVDKSENLYLIDAGPALVKYDPRSGTPRSIGRRGEGPGEYRNVNFILLNEQEGPAVYDYMSGVLHNYDAQGAFLNSTRIRFSREFQAPFAFLPSGRLAGIIQRFEPDKLYKVLALFDLEGKQEKELASWLEMELKAGAVGGVMGGILHNYTAGPLLCLTSGGYLCYGHNLEYKLTLVDHEGQVKAEITRPKKPESTRELARQLEASIGREELKRYNLPATKPFFQALLADDEGRIYVIRTPDFQTKEKTRRADVFSESGAFLFSTELPRQPAAIRNGAIYALDRDEDGESVVLKFIILNRGEMPKARGK